MSWASHCRSVKYLSINLKLSQADREALDAYFANSLIMMHADPSILFRSNGSSTAFMTFKDIP